MFEWFKPKEATKAEPKRPANSFFSTHRERDDNKIGFGEIINDILASQPIQSLVDGSMDDSSGGSFTTKALAAERSNISDALVMWYSSQGFIGHQLCAIIAQNWLINKACTMPARDAIRKGYNIVSVDGDDLPDDAMRLLKRYDRAMKINSNLEQFIRMGRIFGIRIAMFKVESTDKDYYEKPFNIDGITPNSYKGIVQVDPYWTAPMLDGAAASQPDTMHFYEPTFWMINGKKHHRSHLIIYRHDEPADLLKPQYLYGGVPLPQQIMERVYAAERVANEAPQLAQTKRTNIWLTDMEKFVAAGDAAIGRLNDWSFYRDNYGIKLGDKEGDEFTQTDTSLADLDSVIMTQYQIVAAQARMPSTKLMGTQPKGFNSTGEYEESSYHEELESIQEHDLTPFLERHHALVMQSYVIPKLKVENIDLTIAWNPLDSPTAKELADTNLTKAQTGAALIGAGALTSEDERQRIAMDKTSGYHELGLEDLPDDYNESDDYNEQEGDEEQEGDGVNTNKSDAKAKTEPNKVQDPNG
jgi:phage-related protein (TIGR01555 family)